MKNINYSIKKQFKISDEGICLLPMLLRALCRLTKKQLLLLEEIYSNYPSSTEGEIITQSHRTVNAKGSRLLFRMKEASHSTRKHYTIAAQVRSLQQLGKIYYFIPFLSE